MQWKRVTRLGTMSGALALSACMMPYDEGAYQAPPPVYSADESPDLYAFIDRADSLWEAIGDAPPDYAFSFEGAEPWAWDAQDGDAIIVEETPDGIQSYYFGPGESGPYLAVRPGRSFGFDGEAVAVVYGPDGGAMPRDAGAAHLGEGVALYARGRALRRAMLQRQWREVDSQAWIDASPFIWGTFQLWDEGRYRHPGWGRHREVARDAAWRHRLDAEQLRRRAQAEQFRHWREGGFQGPPPGRFHRPGEGQGPGAGRPGRPGEPGAGGPRQPGQWGRPGGTGGPGAGRPPRPEAGQQMPGRPRPPGRPVKPGLDAPEMPVRDDAPQTNPTPTPAPPPGAGVPRRPGWGGRPWPGRVDDTSGASPQPMPVRERPQWGQRPPRPEGSRPGWPGRRPDAASGTPETTPPQPRPSRNWSADTPRPERTRLGGYGRRPDAAAGTPDAVQPQPRPVRNWSSDAPRPQQSAPPQVQQPRPAPSVSSPPPPRAPRPTSADTLGKRVRADTPE